MFAKPVLKAMIATTFCACLTGTCYAQSSDYTAAYASLNQPMAASTAVTSATRAVNKAYQDYALAMRNQRMIQYSRTATAAEKAAAASAVQSAQSAVMAASTALTAAQNNLKTLTSQIRAAQAAEQARKNATYTSMVSSGQITSLRPTNMTDYRSVTTSLGRR